MTEETRTTQAGDVKESQSEHKRHFPVEDIGNGSLEKEGHEICCTDAHGESGAQIETRN